MHIPLGDLEPDAVIDGSYDLDGYCDLLPATPPVTFAEEYVGDTTIGEIDEEASESTEVAVEGVDAIAATDRHFAKRDLVVGDELADVLGAEAHDSATKAVTEERPGHCVAGAVVGIRIVPREPMGYFAEIEALKASPRAFEPNLTTYRVDELERYESAEPAPVLRLDEQMRRGACDRVDNDSAHLAADAVDARHVGADRETGHVRHHRPLPSSLSPTIVAIIQYNCCYHTKMRRNSASSKPDEAVVEEATDAVLLVSRALVGVAASSLAATESQITLHQYRALVVLHTRGDQNVSSLAEILGIQPSTLTRLADRLIAKRLIERNTSDGSRREVTLALSEKGRALVRTETERRRRAIREIVARIDPATQSAIADVFNALADAADEVHDYAWKLGWTG